MSSERERLLTENVDPLGELLHADRRVQAVGEGQDNGVDTPHHVAVVAQGDPPEAKATTQVPQARGAHIAQGRQFNLGRRQHRRKMGAFRDGAPADDADAHGSRPPRPPGFPGSGAGGSQVRVSV